MFGFRFSWLTLVTVGIFLPGRNRYEKFHYPQTKGVISFLRKIGFPMVVVLPRMSSWKQKKKDAIKMQVMEAKIQMRQMDSGIFPDMRHFFLANQ